MKDCGAESALEGLTKAFARVPAMMLESLDYYQSKEMAQHKELTSRWECQFISVSSATLFESNPRPFD
jgi:hypothetical protein